MGNTPFEQRLFLLLKTTESRIHNYPFTHIVNGNWCCASANSCHGKNIQYIHQKVQIILFGISSLVIVLYVLFYLYGFMLVISVRVEKQLPLQKKERVVYALLYYVH